MPTLPFFDRTWPVPPLFSRSQAPAWDRPFPQLGFARSIMQNSTVGHAQAELGHEVQTARIGTTISCIPSLPLPRFLSLIRPCNNIFIVFTSRISNNAAEKDCSLTCPL